ncbi:hypothetical protein ACP26L_24310 [Paenibacillus sp. S-38]
MKPGEVGRREAGLLTDQRPADRYAGRLKKPSTVRMTGAPV